MDLLIFTLIVLYVVCFILNEDRPANKPPTSCPKEPPHIEKEEGATDA